MAVDFLQNGAEAFQDDPLAFAQNAENWIYEGWKWAKQRVAHKWETGWAEFKAAPGAVIHRTWQETRVAISLALDFIPVVGDIKSLIEAKVGTDLAGHKLTEFEKGLMLAASLVGMFTIADELMDAAKLGRQFLTNADNAADLLKAGKGLDNLDEAVDVTRGLKNSALKHADDLDNAKATFRNADDIAVSNRLDNLDDFTGGRRTADEAAPVRDRLARSSDQGSLSRRLDDARARRQADEVGASCAYNSFTEGTPVHTDEGQKPIEDIEVGDKVLAEDPDTGDDKRGYFEVVALTSHAEADILHITIEAEAKDKAEKTATLDSGQDNGHNDRQQLNTDTMEITPEHPVYVEGPGWLWAESQAHPYIPHT